VSGEESVAQTALRARRLGVQSGNVEIASESRLENILSLAQAKKPHVLVVDSIQTVYMSEIQSAPGSVSQVRECASQLMGLAKGGEMAVLIIGHVTKEGNIAGPKVLEHMVDTVLSFEGDSNHQFRLLRALKNRFGATNELGVFQMASQGMEEVSNPSELFLEERGSELIGSSVFSAMEGSRPLLCEVQALTSYSPMAMPRRTAIGFDVARVHLLVAVLDKHLDLNLHQNDVFVNVVGGLKLSEPAADLAVAAALLSTAGQQELDPRTCFFGEIGLTGEIRAASFAEERIREALKLGFTTFVLPESNRKHVKHYLDKEAGKFVFIRGVRDLEKIIGRPVKKNRKPSPQPDRGGHA
ncbi:MAG: DNA repair protein RadA, partial [Bdellovibrionales bacterium]|nr:DNA repair protein RadA [Bdellovibrionales bacterium]